MPYEIRPRGSQYCVIKIDDGTTMGCHDTRREAQAQLTALRIAESERGKYKIE